MDSLSHTAANAQKQIDDEVSRIINEQYERAKQILRDHKEGHAKLAETLLTKEVMYAEDLVNIFGKRQWKSRTEEIMKLQAERDAKRALEEAEKEKEKKNNGKSDEASVTDAEVVDVTATVVEVSPNPKIPTMKVKEMATMTNRFLHLLHLKRTDKTYHTH